MRKPRIALLLAAALAAPAPAYAQASASPYTSAVRYDPAGRTAGTIAPDSDGGGPIHHAAVRNTYNAAGWLTKVETGELANWQSEAVVPTTWPGFTIFRTLETVYDSMGRKTRDTLREGAAGPVRTITDYSYDELGRLECTAVRMNLASPPTDACTPSSGGPDRITKTIYDAAGQRLQLRVGVGTADEGAEATWAYNLNGQVTTVIDGNGNRAELRYDRHGRQDRWTFPSTTRPASYNDATQATALATAGSVNAADYEQYGYDPNGNRTSLRKRDNAAYAYGDIVYEYDALNRVTRKTVPERAEPHPAPLAPAQTRDVFYGYDLRNLQLYARFDSQSGEGITNAYDGFGRVASSSTNMGGTTRTLTYAYNAHGARTQITHPDGIFFGTLHDALDRPYYAYDSVSAPIAYYTYTPFGTLDHSGHGGWTFYGYDGVQRPSVRFHAFSGGAGAVLWTYGYNPAGGLGSVTRDNYAFAWTRHYAVNRTYTTNGLNQYSAASSAQGNTSYGYDLNGNLTFDGTYTYAYDIENRLVSSTNGAAMVYDPLGRLYRVSDATHDTRVLYDGDALVVEYGANGTVQRRHVHGAGADTAMITYAGADLSTPDNLFADHQGSIIAHANAGGATVAVNTYDEYGIPGLGNTGRFQYTGQVWLDELGMYYYKARIYSPTLGRFLQTDPIGYDDQLNLYAYVGNDPVNHTDPTGMRVGGRIADWEDERERRKDGDQRSDSEGPEFAQLRTARTPARPPTGNARMAPGGIPGQRLADPRSHVRIHVGRTRGDLYQRLQREAQISAASSFRNERIAEAAMNGAIRANQGRINDWIQSGSPFPLEIRYPSNRPLGEVWYRGESAPRASGDAVFRLRPIQPNVWIARQHDYFVETGWLE